MRVKSKKISGANSYLNEIVASKQFDFDKFITTYAKIFPNVLESSVGREFVMHALNVSAEKSYRSNGCFYASELAESLAECLPRMTVDIACRFTEEPELLTEPLIPEREQEDKCSDCYEREF